MDHATTEQYKRLRAKGWPSRSALKQARHVCTIAPIDWDYSGRGDTVKTAEWDSEGYTIRASVFYDYDADRTDYGRFTDRWAEGAITNPTWHYQKTRVYRYFIPTNSLREEWEYNRRYHGRHEAYTIARAHVLEAMQWANNEGIETYGIVAKAYRADVQLGEDGLYGIDVIDSATSEDTAYIDSTARDCASNAIEAAQNAVKRLCASVQEA